MVEGVKGMDSFLTEIRRRVEKHDPSIAMHWDRLAAKHEVPDLIGKMPPEDQLPLLVEDPANLAQFKTEIGRRLEANDPTIAASWDSLTALYKVPRLTGHVPADLAAFASSPPEAVPELVDHAPAEEHYQAPATPDDIAALKTDLRSRLANGESFNEQTWDDLARSHNAPELVGNLPNDVPAYAASP